MTKIRQATNLKNYHIAGALGISVYPWEIARNVLGGNPGDAAGMFAYLFRRFGYPIHGYDPDKELAEYLLTTPMDGVLLRLTLGGSGFGLGLSNELYAAAVTEERAPFDAWNAHFRAWCKQEHNFPVYELGSILVGDPRYDEIQAEFQAWLAARGLVENDATDETEMDFWNERYVKERGYTEQYAAIYPLPEDVIEPDSLRAQVADALGATISDLLRPVYLDGGLSFTIRGEGEMEDAGLDPVPPSPMAGCGIGDGLYDIYLDEQKREAWWDLLSRIEDYGNGDLLAGLRLAADALTGNREQTLVRALEEIRDIAKSWEGREQAPYWNLGDKAAAAIVRYNQGRGRDDR